MLIDKINMFYKSSKIDRSYFLAFDNKWLR